MENLLARKLGSIHKSFDYIDSEHRNHYITIIWLKWNIVTPSKIKKEIYMFLGTELSTICDKCTLPKLVERAYTRVSQPSTKYFCLIYVMSGWLVKHYTISLISDISTGPAYNKLLRVYGLLKHIFFENR